MSWAEITILCTLIISAVAAWYHVLVVLKNQPCFEEVIPNVLEDNFPVAVGEEITAHQLGEIEENIKDLDRVIIAAHQVEEPEDSLRKAVKANLQNKVDYLFLVSKSVGEEERAGWIRMFVLLAEVVLHKSDSAFAGKDVVHISALGYDWLDTPYVFYETESSDGQRATIAFRGNQFKEGIAEKYTRLPAEFAYTLALALLSDAPEPMDVHAAPFHKIPIIGEHPIAPSEEHNEE